MQKSHPFVKWIRLKKRLLTFVGALIVFTTFLVKDGFREQLRDLQDSIDKSKTAFVFQAAIASVMDSITGLGHDINDHPAEDVHALAWLSSTQEAKRWQEYLSSNEYSLENTSNLISKLPNPNKDNISKISELKNDIKRVTGLVDAYATRLKNIPRNSPAVLQEVKLSIDLQSKVVQIDNAVTDLQNNVFDDAEEQQKYYERRYSMCNWASFFLYAFGWGLGLLGRLAGVDGLDDSGD